MELRIVFSNLQLLLALFEMQLCSRPGPTGPVLLTGAWDGRWHEWDLWPTRLRTSLPEIRLRGSARFVKGLREAVDGDNFRVACNRDKYDCARPVYVRTVLRRLTSA